MELGVMGTHTAIAIADADKATINGSSEGDNDIALTNFSMLLYKDGEEVADESTIVNSPYNFQLDNIGNGRYKVVIDLTLAGVYSLHMKHSTDMQEWRIADWDVQFIDDIGEQTQDGNRELTFTKAVANVPVRKVKKDYLDYVTIKIKRSADADWSSPIKTTTLYYWYETLGDKQPIKVGASS
jgi:hypothetical protein